MRIRETLSNITNTNIIVITPIYNYAKPLYNYRVEIVNNILSHDILSHNYGYLLDSNKDLTLNMFSLTTGKIKSSSVKNILERTAYYVSSLQRTFENQYNIGAGVCKDQDDPSIKRFFLV